MIHNVVTVIDTCINTHKAKRQEMYLKRHWAVNALSVGRKVLSSTLAVKLMSAMAQSNTNELRTAA